MLELKNIKKVYAAGDNSVTALDGISLRFRKNEFVSILGRSGCGKTTLLNIIGGLDRYTSGDLIINGKSTKDFTDGDWDVYRNRSIGFVFQSYNLIPHQSVLSNVELALTLSGVSSAERRKRATEALCKVGLGDQLHKKPNQMSGGQMQRVAIARALVNNPDILLADEPTGALDTNTSTQIMELLHEVARDRLVIMVTHNPELAREYSTRIVTLSDGKMLDDTNPSSDEEIAEASTAPKKKAKKTKKKPLSFGTAISLSLNNLMTKKMRTVLTSFAGSIGIIGIALILSLSNGIQGYIDRVQEDTLSTYPLSIYAKEQDYSSMLAAMTQVNGKEDYSDSGMIYVDDSLGTMMSSMSATVKNNLVDFKKYIEANQDKLDGALSDIKYTYDFDLQVFTADGKTQVNPTTIFENMGDAFAGVTDMMEMSPMGSMGVMSQMIDNRTLLEQQYELVGENSHWPESANEVVLVITSNNQISKMALYMLGVLDQGELEEIMKDLMTDGSYDTTPLEPYSFDDFIGMKFRLLNTSDFYYMSKDTTYTVDGQDYPVWRDYRDDLLNYDQAAFVTEHGTELVISGIVRPKEGVSATSISSPIGYTKALTDYILEKNAESAVINQQKATPTHNVLTGREFERRVYTKEDIDQLIKTIDDATMDTFYAMMKDEALKSFTVTDMQSVPTLVPFMSDAQIADLLRTVVGKIEGANMGMMLGMLYSQFNTDVLSVDSLDDLIYVLPVLDLEKKATAVIGSLTMLEKVLPDEMPAIYDQMNKAIKDIEINDELFVILLQYMDDEQFARMQDVLYQMAPQTDATYESTLKLLGDAEKASPASINFYAKDFASKEVIESFISDYNAGVEEADKISYTDIVGVMMSSVSIIIDVISYVLIAFVSISLVVSSIMIGIITYISVLERTKEIGILRSIGASKKDISRVFNAETLIVGFTAGAIGILSTILLCFPINAIVRYLTGIPTLTAALPLAGGIALVIISMLLTFVSGLIPSGLAAKKDPVEALRTE